MSRRAAWLLLLFGTALEAPAQRLPKLPSEEPKSALTRNENWGIHLGVDVISAVFQPTLCESSSELPDGGGRVLQPAKSCGEGEPNVFSTRGIGIGLNGGVMFLRHLMLGGEAWVVGFRGNRSGTTPEGAVVQVTTTNSIVGSAYLGAITSPIGTSPRFGRKVWLGMLAGKSHWTGRRECDLCSYDPLKMGRPWFVEPFAMFGGGDTDGGGGVRLAYRQHFGGFAAMHSALTLGLFFALGKL